MATPLSDTSRTARFYLSEVWRRFAGRLALGRISSLRFAGTTPERLLVAPIDLRMADPHIAAEIYAGRFAMGGARLDTEGQSPFQLPAPNRAFFAELHGFGWLRHMRAADHELAASNARSLVDEWIATHGRTLRSPAWAPELIAARLIAWFSHSPVVLRGADHGFYRRFLKSIALQVRLLRHIARALPDGEVRFKVRIALAMASLCVPASTGAVKAAARHLDSEFERQILPDGGHISRNAQVLVELLTDLLPLRQTYINVGHRLPIRMAAGIDRMFSALRFFRHASGELALFNGATAMSAETLLSVLRYDDTAGLPFREAPHSGYQRLAAGRTVLIADTGRPPAGRLSRNAYAGCLAFEFSSGSHRFIVNAGGPLHPRADYQAFARTTAGQSTLTLNDTSSLRFSRSGFLGPVVIGGVSRVTVTNLDRDGDSLGFSATHDGYLAPFGKLHARDVRLSADGTAILGEDRILRPGGKALAANDPGVAAVRFHIHPLISFHQQSGGDVRLMAADGESWMFECDDVAPVIEDDVHFADVAGARASRQIVLYFALAERAGVSWTFRRVPPEDAAEEADFE